MLLQNNCSLSENKLQEMHCHCINKKKGQKGYIYTYIYICSPFDLYIYTYRLHTLLFKVFGSVRFVLNCFKRQIFLLFCLYFIKKYSKNRNAEKAFQLSLFQSSVSYDPPKILLLCWFDAQDHYNFLFNLYLTRRDSLRLKISFAGVSWSKWAAIQSVSLQILQHKQTKNT